MRWLPGPYTDAGTTRVVAYLMDGLGLGILVFTLVVTGVSLGLELLVTVFRVPVLAATLSAAQALENGVAHGC